MNLTEQAARLTELRGEILTIADAEGDLSPEDEARYAELNTEFDTLSTDHAESWTRAATYAVQIEAVRSFEAGAYESTDPAPGLQFKRDADPFEKLDEVRFLDDDKRAAEYRGRALKAIEAAPYVEDRHGESAARLVEQGDADGSRAQYIVEHDGPEYIEAFNRYMRAPQLGAAHAVRGLSERAAWSLTGANGGLAIPQFLDPTIILANDGSTNPFRAISTVKTITVDQWDGLSSAGVTAEWIAEATEVADATPTFTGPTITPRKADAYLQGSIEVIADSALSGEIGMLIQDAKDNLEATAFVTGNGTTQPFGIVTALGLTTASRVAGSSGAATAADLVAADIYALDNDLGSRYRPNAQFVAGKKTYNALRQLGTANNYHAFWTDFGGGLPAQLIGYPTHVASAFDQTIVSGSTDDVMVLGDFKAGYYIVDRMGTELVYNPLVLGSNRRPSGEVGWVAFWRTGADSVNDAAFRMLRL